MSDYISRDAILNSASVLEVYDANEDIVNYGVSFGTIRALPAADVAEVVRCKDCKFGEVDDLIFPDQYLCHYSGRDWNKESHFCSYGEKRKPWMRISKEEAQKGGEGNGR